MNSMTVTEVAEALGVDASTVRRHVRNLFPGIAANGIATLLSEEHVTRIKQAISSSGRKDLSHLGNVTQVTTDLEMYERTLSVMEWMTGKLKTLQAENDELRPVADAHRILTDATGLSTVAETGKVLGFGEKTFFEMLRTGKILQSGGVHHNIPYQKYMDAGWFRVVDYTIPIRTKKEDRMEVKKQTFITPKGESELAKLFRAKYVQQVMEIAK